MCLQSLWICLVKITHTNEMVQYLFIISGFFHLDDFKVNPCCRLCQDFLPCKTINNASLWVQTTFCLPILLSVDTWVISTFWLLWIKLLWTQVYKYLSPCIYFFWVYAQKRNCWIHMVILHLLFWGTTTLFCSTGLFKALKELGTAVLLPSWLLRDVAWVQIFPEGCLTSFSRGEGPTCCLE